MAYWMRPPSSTVTRVSKPTVGRPATTGAATTSLPDQASLIVIAAPVRPTASNTRCATAFASSSLGCGGLVGSGYGSHAGSAPGGGDGHGATVTHDASRMQGVSEALATGGSPSEPPSETGSSGASLGLGASGAGAGSAVAVPTPTIGRSALSGPRYQCVPGPRKTRSTTSPVPTTQPCSSLRTSPSTPRARASAPRRAADVSPAVTSRTGPWVGSPSSRRSGMTISPP